MAEVVSVSVPASLYKRWKESNRKDISPSTLFQTALETDLDQTNRLMTYWSTRALNAEKKLEFLRSVCDANLEDVKKLMLLHRTD